MTIVIIIKKFLDLRIKMNEHHVLKISINKNIYKKIRIHLHKLYNLIKTDRHQELKLFNFKSSHRNQKVFIVVSM